MLQVLDEFRMHPWSPSLDRLGRALQALRKKRLSGPMMLTCDRSTISFIGSPAPPRRRTAIPPAGRPGLLKTSSTGKPNGH